MNICFTLNIVVLNLTCSLWIPASWWHNRLLLLLSDGQLSLPAAWLRFCMQPPPWPTWRETRREEKMWLKPKTQSCFCKQKWRASKRHNAGWAMKGGLWRSLLKTSPSIFICSIRLHWLKGHSEIISHRMGKYTPQQQSSNNILSLYSAYCFNLDGGKTSDRSAISVLLVLSHIQCLALDIKHFN